MSIYPDPRRHAAAPGQEVTEIGNQAVRPIDLAGGQYPERPSAIRAAARHPGRAVYVRPGTFGRGSVVISEREDALAPERRFPRRCGPPNHHPVWSTKR